MAKPVKLSDALVREARGAGRAVGRTVAAQIEVWAGLGRSIELILWAGRSFHLDRKQASRPLSACLASVDSAGGRARVKNYLKSQAFPHYHPYQGKAGLVLRTDANGRKSVGHFIRGEFVPRNGS